MLDDLNTDTDHATTAMGIVTKQTRAFVKKSGNHLKISSNFN